ncbi:terminase small subunit [Paenibacillus sp. Leaf72]|uniref:terminase small subunit n=1 Tax=Paenibacillus sp. Leaf72 TaxID=1736234 RepID=UPI0007C69118|nr:terminase small subunit [Paenibacillus sp. Leaf72]
MSLTARQARFIDEYLVDLNAAAAARRAGYSMKTAGDQGSRLLANANIQETLQKRMKEREQRTEITQDRVLHELAKIGFSDMRMFTTWGDNGVSLINSEMLSSDQAACIAEVSQTITGSGGSVKFKLHDKVSALEKIGRHLGMFKDKFELKGQLVHSHSHDLRKLSAKELEQLEQIIGKAADTG